MSNLLTKKEANSFLGLDPKIFDNYFKSAAEFKPVSRVNDRGRFRFEQADLASWLDGYKWRTVNLTMEDYSRCLDFALAQHFRGYVASDWGTARQREFGQKITNWVKGQLAEVAVQKFFLRDFHVEIDVDFGIYDKIVPQDVIGIKRNGQSRKPKIGIGIKASKPKSAFLILSENEFKIEERRSDVYILCRPEIPDDHILRVTKDRILSIVKNQQHYSLYKEKIPDFKNIPCEIAGWCDIGELEMVTGIPGQPFSGVRYVKKSGELHKDRGSWMKLISRL